MPFSDREEKILDILRRQGSAGAIGVSPRLCRSYLPPRMRSDSHRTHPAHPRQPPPHPHQLQPLRPPLRPSRPSRLHRPQIRPKNLQTQNRLHHAALPPTRQRHNPPPRRPLEIPQFGPRYLPGVSPGPDSQG